MLKPHVMETDGTRKRHCSSDCANKSRRGHPSPRRIPEHIRKTIVATYPGQGPLMSVFNLSRETIQRIAYEEGVKLNPDVYYKLVHETTRKRMIANNPMKRPEVRAKVAAWREQHPDLIVTRSVRARSKNQRENPSGLEFKLRQILDGLNIEFEPSAVIKPKFVVDIRIGRLIIQADGDYWHGYPRFEPLTERQQSQQRRDKAQDAYLRTCGYSIARIWESDMSKEKVISVLKEHGISRN